MKLCSLLTTTAAAVALAALTACCPVKTVPTFNNADFYTADGKFNEEAAKDAVLKLLNHYNWPVTDHTRKDLWVSDYGTGKYTEVGLAAIMVKNNVDGASSFMLQELFLLPNQMLPEHWHLPENDPAVKVPGGAAKVGMPAKMEGWFVREGVTYTVGEGADNLATFGIKVPDSHTGGVTAKHAVKVPRGEWDQLGKVLGHHWQIAGPEGAIVTEVANVHCNHGVRHLVPAINKQFLGE
jgi:D-lyxose ketol-isomerase